MKILQKFNVLSIVIVTAAYFYLVMIAVRFGSVLYTTDYAYYNYLVDAFIHGRLDISLPPGTLDVSVFNNKSYLYWGPAPVLFILPFYLLFGIHASDTFYTFINCLLKIYIFYLVILEFNIYFKREKKTYEIAILLFSFAFASPNFLFATEAGIWMTNQSIAVLYLLIFYLFYFKFLNAPKRIGFFIIALLFFHLAWLSRLTLIVHGLLLLYPLGVFYQKDHYQFKRALILFSTMGILFVSFFGVYNYLRFGSALETGHKYHQPNERFAQTAKTTLSVNYIPHNAFHYFFNHVRISFEDPRVLLMDREGNSIFSVYPLTLLFLYIFQLKFLNKKFVLLSLGVIVSEMLFFLMFFNTGWVQFGSRYFFDITPLVFLLTAFVLPQIPVVIKTGILVYGIVVNLVGMIIR